MKKEVIGERYRDSYFNFILFFYVFLYCYLGIFMIVNIIVEMFNADKM